MKTCSSCKDWFSDFSKDFGKCKSEKWVIHPNYMEKSDKISEPDMIEVTYNPCVGKNFGCIHHRK